MYRRIPRWANGPPVLEDDAEACELLGEETVPNGKVWWVCHDKSGAPNMDCTPVDGMGNPDSKDGQWLCKEQKMSEQKPGCDLSLEDG